MLKAVAQDSIYEVLDVSELSEEVRRIHFAPGDTEVSGRMTVRRGTSPAARVLAVILRLPRDADDVPVTLRIERRGTYEIWTRQFGGRRLRTVQRIEAGALVETFGLLQIRFEVTSVRGALRFRSVDAVLCGIRVPALLRPIDTTVVSGHGGRMHVSAWLSTRLTGPLLSYEGDVA